ncbi:hypothetical protein Bca52824_047804 [Brassica carinata]|uniref:Uncharacterized protein n=1 Tax=Brassica carinata TaxID=52824 RepID=A0A8X7RH99_BRACI|nr:hypothetical protein Bca52824_047804 [Brassica carinata]
MAASKISLSEESTVCVSVFGSLAEILHMRLEAGVVHPKVMVATNINPKFMGGRLFLNSTSGIHFYFDNDVIASQSLFEEYKQYRGVQKLEAISVWELNIYVLETPHKNLFLHMLYMFQCKCCWGCQVEMLVGEGEDTALFVAFDSAMTKLTCVRAAEVANPMGQGDQDPAGYEFPQLLQDIVGNTYIFHLKLNEANFSSHHKSFTVARIFDHNERISGPTFAPHISHQQIIAFFFSLNNKLLKLYCLSTGWW